MINLGAQTIMMLERKPEMRWNAVKVIYVCTDEIIVETYSITSEMRLNAVQLIYVCTDENI